MPELTYVCDDKRHLVCLSYSAEHLYRMAGELNIERCWLREDHYHIPLSRIPDISRKCRPAASKTIVKIIKGEITEL